MSEDFFIWLWRFCISFVILIMGTAFISTIESNFVLYLFCFSLMFIGIYVVYSNILFQKKGLEKINKENKK